MPGVSLTVTSFQNLFFKAVAGFLGSTLSNFPCCSISICFLFLATFSSLEVCGGCGGGPGAVGCATGVAMVLVVE